MSRHFTLVRATVTLEELADRTRDESATLSFVVLCQGKVAGWTTAGRVLAALARESQGAQTVGQLASREYAVVQKETSLLEVMARMRSQGAEVALVAPGVESGQLERVEGVVTKEVVADYVGKATDWFRS